MPIDQDEKRRSVKRVWTRKPYIRPLYDRRLTLECTNSTTCTMLAFTLRVFYGEATRALSRIGETMIMSVPPRLTLCQYDNICLSKYSI